MLEHGFHGDVAVAQDGGNIGDDAGPVGHAEAQVISPTVIFHGRGGRLFELRHRTPEGGDAQTPRNIHNIGNHGRGRGKSARAGALEHGGADEIALHRHRVENPLHMGQRRPGGNETGMNALFHPIFQPPRNTQQFDAIAQLLGAGDIARGDMADALHVDAVEIDRAAVGHGGKQGQLVGGVHAVHVETWVSLGIAQRLRLGQNFVEFLAGVAHGREDIITGAVQNPRNTGDAVARQPLAQGLDDGNTPRHRRLIGQRHPRLFGASGQFHAVMGQQRLVGRDHMAAPGHGRFTDLAGDAIGTADKLHHHVGVGFRHHFQGVVETGDVVQRHATVAPRIKIGHRHHTQGKPRALHQQSGLLVEQLQRPGAHRAKTGNGDIQRVTHEATCFSCCSTSLAELRMNALMLRRA